MTAEKNWRTEVTALDYLGHQKKSTTLADRRPVVRKPSDLAGMGPAIAQTALPITDWNLSGLTGVYDGYYSSERAANGPRPEIAGEDAGYDLHHYVGYVVSDSVLGGTQVITDLETGSEYSRTFLRALADPSSVSWSTWSTRYRVLPFAFATASHPTDALDGVPADLLAPDLGGVNYEESFASAGAEVSILQQGVYSGVIGVSRTLIAGDLSSVDLVIGMPRLNSATVMRVSRGDSIDLDNEFTASVTFVNTLVTPASLTVSATQYTGVDQELRWSRCDITRLGDAV